MVDMKATMRNKAESAIMNQLHPREACARDARESSTGAVVESGVKV